MLAEIESAISKGYRILVDGDKFELVEDGKDATTTIAKFEKRGGEVLVYKFDRSVEITIETIKKGKKTKRMQVVSTVFPFFNEIPGLKSMADFILFYKKSNGKCYAVICNMKSKNKHNHPNQVRSAEIFISFIIDSINRQFSLSYNIDFVRKVLFWDFPAKKYSWNIYREKKNSKDFEWIFQSNEDRIDVCNLDAICNT